jgi:hypothetical protein
VRRRPEPAGRNGPRARAHIPRLTTTHSPSSARRAPRCRPKHGTALAVRGEHLGAGRKRTALAVRGEHLGAGQSTATRTHGHSSARRARRCRPERCTATAVRGEHHSAGQSHRCGGRNLRTARTHRARQSATHGFSSARRAPRCRPERHRCGGGTSRRRAPPGQSSRQSTA